MLDPADEASQMGPMVSAGQRDAVQRYVDATTIAFQGSTPGGDGFWLPAMVTEAKDVSEPVWREEVFGPLVAVMAFDDEEEAIALANDTGYGLGSYVYTTDPEQADRVANGIDAGMVYVNIVLADSPELPFGGVKRSGTSREMGLLAADEFVNKKLVRVAP